MTQDPLLQLVITQGPTPGRTFDLEQDSMTIGRDLLNSIVIDTVSVSRKHARLKREGKTYVLEDLGSTNGTLVNGRRLVAPFPLREGDIIQFGTSVQAVFQTVAPTAPQTIIEPQQTMGTLVAADLSSGIAQQQLILQNTRGMRQIIPLQREQVTLGNASDNDIRLDDSFVPAHQARLEKSAEGYRIVPLESAVNPLLIRGRAVTEPRILVHGDIVRIPGTQPGDMLTLTYFDWTQSAEAIPPVSLSLVERSQTTIGRDEGNDVCLDNPLVSRYHAVIERVGTRFRLRDLKSTNGTFVNGARVASEVWLDPQDTLSIGGNRFVLAETQLQQIDDSGGLRVEAIHLNKRLRPDLNLLSDISLCFQPREFIVLVGLSGSGKSTLMDALAGYRPATDGDVVINTVSLYKHFDAVRNDIGYVPQRDIIHMELTVFEALDFAAQLRMPKDVSTEERHQRVRQVLADLDLTERANVQVNALSGGQQKRVSIGVELLTKPRLFFLDEPTSGLDPGTETTLMQLMRNLADQGRTIILITHATKNVMLADKVIFLVRGGRVAWFGPPDEALVYFDRYRSSREQRTESMEFDKIYAILEDSSKGGPSEWQQRYQSSAAYDKYIVKQLQGSSQTPACALKAAPLRPVAARAPRISSLRQFAILSARNLAVLVRDRFSLILMLVTAPLLACLDFMITRRDIFNNATGDGERVTMSLFGIVLTSIFVGALSQMREIVKEAAIYKRERLVNLRIVPYVMSKLWIAMLLALYQAAAYVFVRYIAVQMPGGVNELGALYVTIVLACMAGMMLGLAVSAFAPTANAAPLLTIIVLIPQILMAGALLPIASLGPVGEGVSSVMSTRWAFEALVSQTGFGAAVARDACWQRTEAQRSGLSSEYKDANCSCMGSHIFEKCSFPGLLDFYDASVDTSAPAKPAEPAAPGNPPPQPTYPSTPTPLPTPRFPPTPVPPTPPATVTFQGQVAFNQAMDDYRKEMQAYNEKVESIQKDYNDRLKRMQEDYNQQVDSVRQRFTAEMNAYQTKVDTAKSARDRYQTEIDQYQEQYKDWQRNRSKAVAGAEAMLGGFYDRFGNLYAVNVPSRWLAQGAIIVGLCLVILLLQKRKDNV